VGGVGAAILLFVWMGVRADDSAGNDAADATVVITPSLGADPEVLKNHPLAEKCFKCHGSEVASQEWAKSGHAHNLTVLRQSPLAADSCLGCHSSGYKPPAPNEWGIADSGPRATLETAINEVACSSCHTHASKRKNYLTMPVSQLCGSCHRMDCGCSGKGIVHQSQSELFAGVKGNGVPPMPSAHSKEMKGDCTVCHMYRPADSKKTVLETGGHTFKATMESCLPCHGQPGALVKGRKAEVDRIKVRVAEALETAESRGVPKSDIALADTNYQVVLKDSGFGYHNPTYAVALLQRSLRYLQVPEEPSVSATSEP
jgi:predicted CXXCH cytochrome family protein